MPVALEQMLEDKELGRIRSLIIVQKGLVGRAITLVDRHKDRIGERLTARSDKPQCKYNHVREEFVGNRVRWHLSTHSYVVNSRSW